MKNATRCVSLTEEERFGAVSTPIYQTATFRQPTAVEFGEYDYSRSGNPTRCELEKKLAELERAEHAFAFSSGMSALSAIIKLLTTGDEILAGSNLYGGSIRLLERLPRLGINVRYVDTTDVQNVSNALTSRTKMLLIETPTNPFQRVSDIAALAELTRANDALLVVDNTMLSPCLQNPISHGADIVYHSGTKFLSGHSDVTAGAVIVKDEAVAKEIAFVQNAEGTALAPFDSWLLLRGIKTLDLRVEKQCSNALKVADFLSTHPAVTDIFHPAFAGVEARRIHERQASGGGSVIAFTTGDAEFSRRIVESTKLCSIAVSFGSVNSTISLPCYMSHASIPAGLRDELAPPRDLIRISVGIESVEDVIEDLREAIRVASGSNVIAISKAVGE
ncbi:MAG: aminotransferase class I/II-fold pyridoxal phosphate-dependent enzyme [Acidobacteria bacterium]|nr:aminotransferase class I/II-fold pyridoxal phosphate-dependent enzyme [Acidobacteriota bacterium]